MKVYFAYVLELAQRLTPRDTARRQIAFPYNERITKREQGMERTT